MNWKNAFFNLFEKWEDFTLDPGETADYLITAKDVKLTWKESNGSDDYIHIRLDIIESGHITFWSSEIYSEGYELLTNPRIGKKTIENEIVTD